jgi:hypothetical protein
MNISMTSNVTNAAIIKGQGTVMSLVVGVPGTASQVAIYDGLSPVGQPMITLNTTSQLAITNWDLRFTTGLTIVTAGTAPANLLVIAHKGF